MSFSNQVGYGGLQEGKSQEMNGVCDEDENGDK